MKIVETPLATTYDWSLCRSPARAKRRANHGYPQRIRTIPGAWHDPATDTLFIHPVLNHQLKFLNINPEQIIK
jgi:hypothetical protein